MNYAMIAAAGLLAASGAPARADDVTICVESGEHAVRVAACSRMFEASQDAHIQAVALINRANAKMRLRQFDEALADADRSVALEPGLMGALGKRGIIRFARREMDAAIADYSAELKRDPKDLETLVNRAVAYFEKDQHAAAITDITAAIKINPKHPTLYEYRAAMHLDSGDVAKAVADYNQVLKLDPENAKAKAQLKDLGQ